MRYAGGISLVPRPNGDDTFLIIDSRTGHQEKMYMGIEPHTGAKKLRGVCPGVFAYPETKFTGGFETDETRETTEQTNIHNSAFAFVMMSSQEKTRRTVYAGN